jgi:hypothetical protein
MLATAPGCGSSGPKAEVAFQWDNVVNRVGDLVLTIEPNYIALYEGIVVRGGKVTSAFQTPAIGLVIKNSGKTAYTFQPASSFWMIYVQSQGSRATYRQPADWAVVVGESEWGLDLGTSPITINPSEQKKIILQFPRINKGDNSLPAGVHFQDRSLNLPMPDASVWGIKTLSPEIEADLKKAKTLGDVALLAQLSYRVIPLGQKWP